MRPCEILVSVTNLLVFCVLAVPQLYMGCWTGYVVLGALLLATAQALIEGPRW